jgi:sugar lactone lactonase YvrE
VISGSGFPTVGSYSLSINWTHQANTDNSPIDGYEVNLYDNTNTLITTSTDSEQGLIISYPLDNTTRTFTAFALTNIQHYFKIRAYTLSSTGNGPRLYSPYVTSSTVYPNVAPDAPAVTPTSQYRRIQISYTAPTFTGRAAITAYRLTLTSAQSGGFQIGSTTYTDYVDLVTNLPIGTQPATVIIDALTNGETYAFTLEAINSASSSFYSPDATATFQGTPEYTVPSAPSSATASPVSTNDALTITWNASSAANGDGSPVGWYVLTLYKYSGGAWSQYDTIQVNVDETGASVSSVPSVPSVTITVSASAPYTYTYVTGVLSEADFYPRGLIASVTAYSLNNLASPNKYTQVYNSSTRATESTFDAVNSWGKLPFISPTAPQNYVVVSSSGTLDISWDAVTGNNTGGLAVKYKIYNILVSSSTPLAGYDNITSTSQSISSLVNGTIYRLKVTAFNAVAESSYAATTAPSQLPAPIVTQVTATNANTPPNFNIYWTSPIDDGGSGITQYTITATPATGTAVVLRRTGTPPTYPTIGVPYTTGTLTAVSGSFQSSSYGIQYTFTITATNSSATGPISLASSSITPVAPAGQITSTPTASWSDTATKKRPTLNWTQPTNNGGRSITGYKIYIYTAYPGTLYAPTPNWLSNGTFTRTLAQLSISGTNISYTFTNDFEYGNTYYFAITTLTSSDAGVNTYESPNQSPATAGLVAPPTAITNVIDPVAPNALNPNTGSTITVYWTGGLGVATYAYTLYDSTGTNVLSTTSFSSSTGGTTKNVVFNGLSFSTTYFIKVTGTNTAGSAEFTTPSITTNGLIVNVSTYLNRGDVIPNTCCGITYSSITNTIYFTELEGHAIYQIMIGTNPPVATVFAGNSSTLGTTTGTRANARFKYPRGLLIAPDGHLYVADSQNHRICKVMTGTDSSTAVTTLLGSPGVSGSTNGTGTASRFNLPTDIALSSDSSNPVIFYITDQLNHLIRKVVGYTTVSTFAGTLGSAGVVDGLTSTAKFNYPTCIAVSRDISKNIYITEASPISPNGGTIRRITPSGQVDTLAGSSSNPGLLDGTGTAASFVYVGGITVGTDRNIYVAAASRIRKITPCGAVTTIAGTGASSWTVIDGIGTNSTFDSPWGIVVIPSLGYDNLYIAERNRIRLLAPSYTVTNAATKPCPPLLSGTVTSTAASITFSFNEPLSIGGVSLSGYTLSVRIGSSLVAFKIGATNYSTGQATIVVPGTYPSQIIVAGLTYSTTYSISLVANNSAGSSPALAISPTTTISVTAPRLFIAAGLTETTAVTSTAVSITFSFNVPLTLGGLTVSGYRLSVNLNSSPAAFTYSSTNYAAAAGQYATIALPGTYPAQIIVSGLTYSTASITNTYSISLVATYTGITYFTSPVLSITKATAIVTVPGPPTISGTTTSAARTITFSFTAPTNTGGISLSGYTLSVSQSGSAVAFTYSSTNYSAGNSAPIASAGSVTVSGLTHSTTYSISLVANNLVGSSSELSITQATTIISAPVISGTTTSTPTSITFSFTAPTTLGGLTVSGYRLSVSLNSSPVAFTYSSTNYTAGNFAPIASAGSVTISGLEYSLTGSIKTYNLSLLATYTGVSFTSPALAITQATVIVTAPTKPNLSTTAGDFTSNSTSITFKFSVPTNTGGLPITSYTLRYFSSTPTLSSPTFIVSAVTSAPYSSTAAVTILPSQLTSVSSLYQLTISGLTLSTSYIFRLNANNAAFTDNSVNYETITATMAQVFVVSTFAGSGSAAFANGTGTSASFNFPSGVALATDGTLYVVDTENNRIRTITSTGAVSMFAGSGTAAFADGTGTSASFNRPSEVTLTADGTLYVADTFNHRIRKITSTGVVSTFAGGIGTSVGFSQPSGVAVATDGTVYVADLNNSCIRKITSGGVVTTFAGNGAQAFADGTGTSASFYFPRGVAVATDGTVYVADSGNNRIRRITTAGVVSTVAGNGSPVFAEGTGTSASLWQPRGVAVATDGTLYVSESSQRICRITSTGVVSTYAGSGTIGFLDGTGTSARFRGPTQIALATDGTLYVADFGNHRIRKIIIT